MTGYEWLLVVNIAAGILACATFLAFYVPRADLSHPFAQHVIGQNLIILGLLLLLAARRTPWFPSDFGRGMSAALFTGLIVALWWQLWLLRRSRRNGHRIR